MNTFQPIMVRPCPSGWELLCPPGALATYLHQASQDTRPIRAEWVSGQYLNLIPYTAALDAALTGLIDQFIVARYTTGQVQLKLFNLDHI